MKKLVQDRMLPEGDPRTQLQFLQKVVLEQFVWIRQHSVKKLPVDKETYRRFVGIFLSSLYVFSPQGRCQGIEDLKFGQAQELLHDGYTQTTKFKTQARWGFQPVTLADESKELLTIYLEIFRPRVAESSTSQPHETLLLNFSGQPYIDIGKELTRFFVHSCNLHITSTRIRSIVETAAEEMYRQGDISLRTRKSVEAINGHTSATVRNFYLQMDRTADVHSARTFFADISQAAGSAIVSASNETQREGDDDNSTNLFGIRVPRLDSNSAPVATTTWAQRESSKHLDWGTSHPEYHRLGVRKVKWSDQELDYIEQWIDNDVQGDTNIAVSRCLTAIRLDPQAVPIFHSHHILNSTRLRNGFDSAMKRKKMLTPIALDTIL